MVRPSAESRKVSSRSHIQTDGPPTIGRIGRNRIIFSMRIATWNVNSLKARLEKVMGWLERAKPDVLLLQETKLADEGAPVETFKQAGYELAHHGEGRWNGVAIASRCGIDGVITNFGEP